MALPNGPSDENNTNESEPLPKNTGSKSPIIAEQAKGKILVYLRELNPASLWMLFQTYKIPKSVIKDPEVQSTVDGLLQDLKIPGGRLPKELVEKIINILNTLFKS